MKTEAKSMKGKMIVGLLIGVLIGICIMGVAFISYLGGEFACKLKDAKKEIVAIEKQVLELEKRILKEEQHKWYYTK